ncbi:hypothetical protein [Mycolicibacterium mengxianglii]|uniref:hypothetical protein n=1 Tax=Mycolicibacterium mengxianglii TaxID=2736649 RepID=UPI0018EEF8A0|nr:hypothetical protein [Mycolicibacterium mengxianglii]
MTPEEPHRIQRLRAVEFAGGYEGKNLLIRVPHTSGSPWTRVSSFKATHGLFRGRLARRVSVILADGSELLFNFNDALEIGMIPG